MPDNKPFQPSKPETIVKCEITKREWNMIQMIRQIGFGKITVQKMNNLIVRVESTTSIVIDEEMEVILSKGVS